LVPMKPEPPVIRRCISLVMFESMASGDFGQGGGLERRKRREDALGEGLVGTQGSAKRNTCAPVGRYIRRTLQRIHTDKH